MENTNTLIKSDHQQHDILNEVARQLSRLSAAFSVTGNEALAVEMNIMADDIAKASLTLSRNASERINLRLKESQQSSANMLSALVAGITISEPQ